MPASTTTPIQPYELELLGEHEIGAGDAMALYDMPDTVQEAFAAGFNRRTVLAQHQMQSLREALEAAKAALRDIVGNSPEDEPEAESYDDTESAYNNGQDVAAWEMGVRAKAGLDAVAKIERSSETGGPSEVQDDAAAAASRERMR